MPLPLATIFRRDYSAAQTTGLIRVTVGPIVVFTSLTLELPWRDNRRGESCIPAGATYRAKKLWSPAFNEKLYEVINVPGRSEVKFHPANYAKQLKGCIALSKNLIDINNDHEVDATASRDAVDRFHAAIEEYHEIDVCIVSGNGGNDHLRSGINGYG